MKQKKKQVISILLTLCMLLGLLPQITLPARATDDPWDGNADTTWGTDYDSSDSFTISTAAQLAKFSSLVYNKKDFSGKTVKLGADITLNDVTNVANWATSAPKNEWTAIGASYYSDGQVDAFFRGTFDGAGHTVSGIYINSDTDQLGLFGFIGEDATVKNVGVTDSYIKGICVVGGVVGYNYSGTVQNCYNTGSVDGSGPNGAFGGVVGCNYSGTVQNCYNTGSVSGREDGGGGAHGAVGGVVGKSDYGTVQNCYNTGSVDGSGSDGVIGGGVVGKNYSGTVQNCYNTGSVTGPLLFQNSAGGVVGETNSDNSMVTGCYYDKSECTAGGIGGNDQSGQADGKTTAEMQTGTPFTDWSTDVWIFENGKYPQLKKTSGGSDDKDTTKPIVSSVSPSGTSAAVKGNFVVIFSEEMDTNTAGTVKLNDGETDTPLSGGKWSADKKTYTLPYFGLAGGKEYTVTISGFKDTVGNAMDADSSHKFTTKDASGGESGDTVWDGNGTTESPYIIKTAAELAGFSSLVNGGKDFSGKTVKMGADIALNDTASGVSDWGTTPPTNEWTAIGTDEKPFAGTFDGAGHTVSGIYINSDSNLQGLFGYIGEDATVKNVGVTDSYIKGNGSVGGVVGYNSGTVENCYNTGSVTGSGYGGSVGGVVGFNDGTVQNCYNTGSVTGPSNVDSDVGGVVGLNSGTVENCYNTGGVTGNSHASGVAGHSSKGTVTGCYYDSKKCTVGGIGGTDQTEKAEGKMTADLQTDTAFKGWSTDVWIFENGKYPQLKKPSGGSDDKDTTKPTVLSVSPSGTSAAVKGNFVVTFSEEMDTNTAGTVKLNDGKKYTTLSGGKWSNKNTVYTFAYSGLTGKTKYTVAISGFKDTVGNAMDADSSHKFTTKDVSGGESDSATITGKVKNDANPAVAVENATVQVMQGSSPIGNAVQTDAAGAFTISNVPRGKYDIVVTKNGQTVTQYIVVSGSAVDAGSIILPVKKINSKLKVTGNSTPKVIEKGLHAFFEGDPAYTDDNKTVVGNGGSVEIELNVQTDDSSADRTKVIANMKSAGYTTGIVLDVNIQKTVTEKDSTSPVTTKIPAIKNPITLVIPLPTALQGKSNYVVYRTHDYGGTKGNKVDTITTANNGGEYIEISADKTYLTLHAKYFSTYAIGYKESSSPTDNSSKGGRSSSHSGSSSSTSSYTIAASAGDGGAISPSGKVSVISGRNKTFTVTPKDEYTVSNVLVDGKSVGAVSSYTFSNVTAAHTISATFAKVKALPYYLDSDGNKVFLGFSSDQSGEMKYIAPKGKTVLFASNPKSFTDISDHWAKSYIDFVTQRELFVGTDTNTFSPRTGMTRAMFAAVIGRLYERSYGSLQSTDKHAFTDCDYNSWYGAYVDWCSANGIMAGMGDGLFAPNREITRQEVAAILYRFAKYMNTASNTEGMSAREFPDYDSISSWAQAPIQWAMNNGIIEGYADGSFAPRDKATRAEVAVILERFVETVLKN